METRVALPKLMLVVAVVATLNPVAVTGVCGTPLTVQFIVTLVRVLVPKLVTVTSNGIEPAHGGTVGDTIAVTPASSPTAGAGISSAPMYGGLWRKSPSISVVRPVKAVPACNAVSVVCKSVLDAKSGSMDMELASSDNKDCQSARFK